MEVNFNLSINEAYVHSPFELMYVHHPSTPADSLLLLFCANMNATNRLILIPDVQYVISQLLALSKERMAAISTSSAFSFQPGDLVYLSTEDLHNRSQKCKHLREQKLGPCKVMSKVGINSYKLLLPKGCRLNHVFHYNLLSHATSLTSLRPRQAEIECDHEEYSVDSISDVKIDT
jgi:hypothetical protein